MPKAVTTSASSYFGLIGPFHDTTVGRGERVVTRLRSVGNLCQSPVVTNMTLSPLIAKNSDKSRKEAETHLVGVVTLD